MLWLMDRTNIELTNAGAKALEMHMLNMTNPLDCPRAKGEGACSFTSTMLTEYAKQATRERVSREAIPIHKAIGESATRCRKGMNR